VVFPDVQERLIMGNSYAYKSEKNFEIYLLNFSHKTVTLYIDLLH